MCLKSSLFSFVFALLATTWCAAGHAQLARGAYSFTVYNRSIEVSIGWFVLLETDEIDVRFDYPREAPVRGAYFEYASRLCFSGFDNRVFPNGCGSLGVRWIILEGGFSIWAIVCKLFLMLGLWVV